MNSVQRSDLRQKSQHRPAIVWVVAVFVGVSGLLGCRGASVPQQAQAPADAAERAQLQVSAANLTSVVEGDALDVATLTGGKPNAANPHEQHQSASATPAPTMTSMVAFISVLRGYWSAKLDLEELSKGSIPPSAGMMMSSGDMGSSGASSGDSH